jgi:hypothetical protein
MYCHIFDLFLPHPYLIFASSRHHLFYEQRSTGAVSYRLCSLRSCICSSCEHQNIPQSRIKLCITCPEDIAFLPWGGGVRHYRLFSVLQAQRERYDTA